MKKLFLFSLMAITMTLLSCNKEETCMCVHEYVGGPSGIPNDTTYHTGEDLNPSDYEGEIDHNSARPGGYLEVINCKIIED